MLYSVYSSNPFIRAGEQKAQFQVDPTKKKNPVLGFGPNCTATLACTCGSEEYFVESLAIPVEGYSPGGPGERPCFLQQRTTQVPGMLLHPHRDRATDYGTLRDQANGAASS